MKYFLILVTAILFSLPIFSQNIALEGYVFETGNRGFLNQVSLTLIDKSTGNAIQNAQSNKDGYFDFLIDPAKDYLIRANKEMFEESEVQISTADNAGKTKAFTKIEMTRAPGYQFEITLAPKRESEDEVVDAIRGALIEVYNNTTGEEVLVLKDHPAPDFAVNLAKGNHYTILVRKEGFLAKRMEAFVNVNGCILCFEGVGRVEPGISDNLTEGNNNGVLLANVEMDRLYKGKTIEIENLYYDTGKWHLRGEAQEQLKKVVHLLKDNPHIDIELGSHTDSRGEADANKELSEKRAQSAVDFLIERGKIISARVKSRGYGEAILSNGCSDGINCTAAEHQENRRTEIKIIGLNKELMEQISLYDIKRREKEELLIQDLMNQEQVKVPEEKSVEDILESDYTISEEEMSQKVNTTTPPEMETQSTEEVASGIIQETVVEETIQEPVVVETIQETIVEETIQEPAIVETIQETIVEGTIQEPTVVETIQETIVDEAIQEPVVVETIQETIVEETIKEPAIVETIQETIVEETIQEAAGAETITETAVEEVEEEVAVMEKIVSTPEEEIEVNENPYSYLNGPKIVILESDDFITSEHEIFNRHKQVFQYIMGEKKLYLIGDFRERAEAVQFLNTTIKLNYPNAYIIEFDKGEIIN